MINNIAKKLKNKSGNSGDNYNCSFNYKNKFDLNFIDLFTKE